MKPSHNLSTFYVNLKKNYQTKLNFMCIIYEHIKISTYTMEII